MKRQFYKMHGAGNDYIFFDCTEEPLPCPSALAVKLSDRHFSVGGDGIVLILPSDKADAKMRMFNADGSEGGMCGNAVRCVGKYLYDVKGLKKERITVETRSGVKTLEVVSADGDGSALSLRVDMGAPIFTPSAIPARFAGERAVGECLEAGGRTYRVTCLSMGNPHCVIFCDDPYAVDLERVGPLLERHPAFPDRVNAEFVGVAARNGLNMRVWERGSGETMACGTGACAAAVAAAVNGLCGMDEDISVRLKGGDLIIRYTGDTVFMTGPAAFAFTGETEI